MVCIQNDLAGLVLDELKLVYGLAEGALVRAPAVDEPLDLACVRVEVDFDLLLLLLLLGGCEGSLLRLVLAGEGDGAGNGVLHALGDVDVGGLLAGVDVEEVAAVAT